LKEDKVIKAIDVLKRKKGVGRRVLEWKSEEEIRKGR
jgi:hypothetical protein